MRSGKHVEIWGDGPMVEHRLQGQDFASFLIGAVLIAGILGLFRPGPPSAKNSTIAPAVTLSNFEVTLKQAGVPQALRFRLKRPQMPKLEKEPLDGRAVESPFLVTPEIRDITVPERPAPPMFWYQIPIAGGASIQFRQTVSP